MDNQNTKNILLLGVGGHGWEVLEDFIDSSQHAIIAYGLTVDYGGSGGLWFRLLENNDFELSNILFGQKRPILPWWDFNKIITHYFVKYSGFSAGRSLDFRSNQLAEHLENLNIFSAYLGLEKDQEKSFWDFFVKAFGYYLEHKGNLDYSTSRAFCFGYPWHDYTYWLVEGIGEFNRFYHKHKLLPENLYLKFTAKNREVLRGQDKNGEKLVGEDIIDHHKTAILPESLGLSSVNGGKNQLSLELINDLEGSDLIIIPTGSIANWMPLLNQKEVRSILLAKKIIWILNPTYSKAEFPIQKYIRYVWSLGLKPYLIGPETSQRDKVGLNNFQDFSDSEVAKVLKINKDYKYDSQNITEVIISILSEQKV